MKKMQVIFITSLGEIYGKPIDYTPENNEAMMKIGKSLNNIENIEFETNNGIAYIPKEVLKKSIMIITRNIGE